MGQPQGGIGYNYGYGAAQFGGAGEFGYQQVMGQSGGYHGAAPPTMTRLIQQLVRITRFSPMAIKNLLDIVGVVLITAAVSILTSAILPVAVVLSRRMEWDTVWTISINVVCPTAHTELRILAAAAKQRDASR